MDTMYSQLVMTIFSVKVFAVQSQKRKSRSVDDVTMMLTSGMHTMSVTQVVRTFRWAGRGSEFEGHSVGGSYNNYIVSGMCQYRSFVHGNNAQ